MSNGLDKYIEKYPTYIEALDVIDDLKKQLEITETQNKMVLEKLELITKSNQELEKQLAEKEKMLERIMSGEYIPANIAEKSLE